MMFGWGGRRLVRWVVTGEATGCLEWWNETVTFWIPARTLSRNCWVNWSPPRLIGKIG